MNLVSRFSWGPELPSDCKSGADPLETQGSPEQIEIAKHQLTRLASLKRVAARPHVPNCDEGEEIVTAGWDFQQVALCVDDVGPRQAVKDGFALIIQPFPDRDF